jgi:hypothetical protein
VGRLQGWKIGAVLGLVYGIFGWWVYYPMIIESELAMVIGPLFVVMMLLSLPVSLFTNPSGHEIILLPLSGLILGIITGKGLEVVAGRMPGIDPWKKGTIIGFSIGLLGAVCIGIIPLFGLFLFGPLVYLTTALLKVILPGLDAGTNLPFFFLMVIVVSSFFGSIAGYILGWEIRGLNEREDTVRHPWIKRLAAAVICIIVVGAILLSSGFIQPAKITAPSYDTTMGRVILMTTIPTAPTNMTYYLVTPQATDVIQTEEQDSPYPPVNIPSETEAPEYAEKILEKYGGLPSDAKLGKVQTEYNDYGKGSQKYPDAVFVEYNRLIDGYQIAGGNGGLLIIKIGENGTPLWIRKNWQTAVPAGTSEIIPASVAFERFRNGMVLEGRPKCFCEFNVESIGPAYYSFTEGENRTYFKPVWLFGGSLSGGGGFLIPVDARPDY